MVCDFLLSIVDTTLTVILWLILLGIRRSNEVRIMVSKSILMLS